MALLAITALFLSALAVTLSMVASKGDPLGRRGLRDASPPIFWGGVLMGLVGVGALFVALLT